MDYFLRDLQFPKLANERDIRAAQILAANGHPVKTTTIKDDYEVATELEKHQWADTILLQTPLNWMGVSWSFKRYMDTVYSAGMDGVLCDDGRSRSDPARQYGSGGTLYGNKCMLSLTFSAPKEAFDDPGQSLFQGKTVDDLALPTSGETWSRYQRWYENMRNTPLFQRTLTDPDHYRERLIEHYLPYSQGKGQQDVTEVP